MKTEITPAGHFKNQHAPRDGDHQSPWQNEIKVNGSNSTYSPGAVDDVLIVGAGITGVTAGLLLQKAGKKCLIAEAHSLGFGTTGGTSAHINTFADTTYKEAERAFGKEGAKLFAEAINEGTAIIKQNIEKYSIICDFEEKTAYVYAEDDDQVKQLDDLFQGTKAVGVDINYVNDVPTPIPFKKAVALKGQAQFHPLKYVDGLAKAFFEAGGVLLENTRIEQVEHVEDFFVAKSGDQEIRAKNVIYATHIPPKITVFSFRCAPYRSYVLGVKLSGEIGYPDALIYDLQDPYHYFRTHEIGGQKYLLAGGNDHKTGHDDPVKAFAYLEQYVRKYYAVAEVTFRWSSQYYIPVDGLPYVGQIPGEAKGIYCATGYNGNGMMLGTISAKVLSDIISGEKSKYEKNFCPARIKPVDGFAEFVSENADVAYHFVADRFSVHKIATIRELPNDTGKVIEVEGQKVAAYRDKDGDLHALNPICTHAKCIVNWNYEEKSWDCPCHGARFDIDGVVLTGPADKDLQQINLNTEP